VIKTFKKDLKDFRVSKGTIRFPMDKPLSTALLKKMVKARIVDIEMEGRKRRCVVRKGRSPNPLSAPFL
jgi:uncharacterized protein YdhG (YjbR/CyaY superfamily)